MIEMIRCEWKKFRTSLLIYFVMMCGVFAPLTNIFFWTKEGVRYETWDAIHTTINFQIFTFAGVLIFSVIAASIYVKEYTDKTFNTLLTVPLSRTQVYMGKFMFLIFASASVYAQKTIVIFLFGFRLVDEAFSWSVLLEQVQVDIRSFAFQIVVLPMYTLLVLIFKNAVVPIIFSFVGAIGNIMVLNINFPIQYYPFFGPLLPLGLLPYEPLSAYGFAVLVFMVGIGSNILYFRRVDVTQ